MSEVKKSLKKLAYLLDTIKITSFGAASYVAPTPLAKALTIGITAAMGLESGYNIGKDAGDKYIGGTFALLGILPLGTSIADIVFGGLERLPYDLLWTVGVYSKALSEVLHYLARNHKSFK